MDSLCTHYIYIDPLKGNTVAKKRYFGITYPTFLSQDLFQKFWKRFMCRRNIHLLDECLGSGHYLVCDACQLTIFIRKISTKWVDKKILEAIRKKD